MVRLPVALALLKLPTGAFTALIWGSFIGLGSCLASALWTHPAQIIAYGIVLGYPSNCSWGSSTDRQTLC